MMMMITTIIIIALKGAIPDFWNIFTALQTVSNMFAIRCCF